MKFRSKKNYPAFTEPAEKGVRFKHTAQRWGDTMIKEFQKFIARGNVLDLAVGIITSIPTPATRCPNCTSNLEGTGMPPT
jgi:hypothetical protein